MAAQHLIQGMEPEVFDGFMAAHRARVQAATPAGCKATRQWLRGSMGPRSYNSRIIREMKALGRWIEIDNALYAITAE